MFMTKLNQEMNLKVRKVSQNIKNKLPLSKQLIERKDTNLYEKVLVSDVNTMDKNKSQMQQCLY